ncbi:putative peptidase [Bergeriella denitrificans]|uniref:Putative peptidase n=2 Tax=Bergeriella denitrificans TaxID=494 RepID=A0A378ULJ9_BERDE|nr:putative peptidase [Bergeriella denitrificans]
MQQIKYSMRGTRVETLSEDTIRFFANEAAKFLVVDKRTRKKMDTFMEMLEEYGIVIDVVADDEWLDITNAMCNNGTILLPNSLYSRICFGEDEAIFIFFHELGHLLLGHKAMLHHSDALPTQQEDSEWQADQFAKCILKQMGIKYFPEQLTLKF